MLGCLLVTQMLWSIHSCKLQLLLPDRQMPEIRILVYLKSSWPHFYQTRSAWSMDQGSNRKHSAVHNFAPTVTKFCVMWEGQAPPHDTKFSNCRCEIVGKTVIFIWSLIPVSSWSCLIKVGPGDRGWIFHWVFVTMGDVVMNLDKNDITVVSHSCHGITNNQELDCLINSLFKNHWLFIRWLSPFDSPLKGLMMQKVKNKSLAWCQH